LGLAAVAWQNWRLWQQDKARLATAAQPTLPPPSEWPSVPTVSVLVPAWNERQHIDDHIRSFLALRYPRKELILCAGGDDGTYERAQMWAERQVIVLEQEPGEGKQQALRRSLPHARGIVIFLTDADCMLDDETFERTLYPVAIGEEQVTTGGARPIAELMRNPFVSLQAASQVYNAARTPRYAPGLLGRNCAVERSFLEWSGGLEAEAPTGTDYVLAKKLVQAGARIRQIPESRVATEYPTTIKGYVRQQSRWLRNILIHGPRFGAKDEVRASLKTSLVGIAMLLMPLSALLFGRLPFVGWLALVFHAFLSRLRYLKFTSAALNTPIEARQVVAQAPMLFLDFYAWSRPLFDYLSAKRRERW
jgi:cellulose synthase/poly-beta-1,6-N-acetylglucosamine synthase-like glycosyltransferase